MIGFLKPDVVESVIMLNISEREDLCRSVTRVRRQAGLRYPIYQVWGSGFFLERFQVLLNNSHLFNLSDEIGLLEFCKPSWVRNQNTFRVQRARTIHYLDIMRLRRRLARESNRDLSRIDGYLGGVLASNAVPINWGVHKLKDLFLHYYPTLGQVGWARFYRWSNYLHDLDRGYAGLLQEHSGRVLAWQG